MSRIVMTKVIGWMMLICAVILVGLCLLSIIFKMTGAGKKDSRLIVKSSICIALGIASIICFVVTCKFMNVDYIETDHNDFEIVEYTDTVVKWGKSTPEQRYRVTLKDGREYIFEASKISEGDSNRLTEYNTDSTVLGQDMSIVELTLTNNAKWSLRRGNAVKITGGKQDEVN